MSKIMNDSQIESLKYRINKMQSNGKNSEGTGLLRKLSYKLIQIQQL